MILHAVIAWVCSFAVRAETREEVVRDLVPALGDLAAWCQEVKLYGTRNEVATALIHFDPDHAEARRWLGHKKSTDGTWKPPRVPASGRNQSGKHLAELATRTASTLDPLCDRLRAVHADDATDNRTRFLIAEDLICLRPESEELRLLRGEVRGEKGWILKESLAARERRAWIAQVGDQAVVDSEEAVPDSLEAAESAMDLDWKPGWRSAHYRVQGTVGSDEMKRVAEHAEACLPFYGEVMKPPGSLRGMRTIYLIPSREDLRRVLKARDLPAGDLQDLDLGRAWLFPENALLATIKPTPVERLDATVNLLMSSLTYGQLGNLPECLEEGLTLYLGQRISTTTLTWAFNPDQYSKEIKKVVTSDLFAVDADWLGAAREALAAGLLPRCHELLYTKLNAMTEQDYIFVFALAAYLVEGRTEDGVAFLKAMGHGKRPEEALEECTDLTFPSLDQRLVRWLEETKGW